MNQLAQHIVAIIKDYHNYRGFQFTEDHVINWVNQFEEGDREFVLQELLHLLQQGIYFSEADGRRLLIERIEELSRDFKFSKPVSFLANTHFLNLQAKEKSQSYLLNILDEELQNKYGIGLAQCGSASKKYALYIDDILATGGTVFKDCLYWLQTKNTDGETNLDKVIKNETRLILSFYCRHNWPNIPWRLKLQLNNDAITKKISFYCDYEIQNHPKFSGQQFNFAYPVAAQPETVMNYFNAIEATTNEATAFRKEGTPVTENLFSSADNRIRFENIILSKGVELLEKAHDLKPNHRPLGAGFPSYKTLGTGTLFFTWRNISNTTPIVFWWKAGGWLPLFPLYKRGE
jgi:hypothetical protein